MDLLRRTVLKGAGASGVLAGLLATGMLKPTLAYANDWNKAAFEAKDFDVALKAVGGDGAAANTALVMKAPEIAENGAVVPIGAVSKIPGTESIAILIERNPTALAASFDIPAGTEPAVSTRVKMAETSDVYVLVKAQGKYYTTKTEIKVTIGGCGG